MSLSSSSPNRSAQLLSVPVMKTEGAVHRGGRGRKQELEQLVTLHRKSGSRAVSAGAQLSSLCPCQSLGSQPRE